VKYFIFEISKVKVFPQHAGGIMSKLQNRNNNNNNNRVLANTKIYLIDKNSLSIEQIQIIDKYIVNINDLFYIVQNPLPCRLSYDQRNTCNICEKKFSIIYRKSHRCKMCGIIQCSDCQSWEKIPHLGYTFPVNGIEGF
ncbi:unnamed protein product, partial [Didymodactylos carnosus]